MKKNTANFLVSIIILILGFIFQYNYLNEFPAHIHAWAQSDRYAIALGFIENNFDFLHPQTFVKNHQFPDEWHVPTNSSITAVDFPMHDFIPALLMKISGNYSPFIFRLYTLLYSFIGLFYLFKVAQSITNDFHKSIFTVVFAATSPVFIYYQAGFLPTIPSLSNVIIACYFYLKYLGTNKNSQFIWSLVFLTFATLTRTTFAIPMLAMLGTEFLRIIRKQSSLNDKIIPVLLAFATVLSYHFYNQFLTQKYGSIFLAQLLPPSDIESVISIVKAAYKHWGTQYFSVLHYVIFIFSAVIAVTLIIIKARSNTTKNRITNNAVFLGLLFIGNLFFAAVMLPQFRHHDYYFLDTFFLPLVLLLIFLLKALPILNNKVKKNMALLFIIAICVPLTINGLKTQKKRRISYPDDRIDHAIFNYSGADHFLDSIGVEPEDNILTFATPAPNLPFILMNRKGYAVMKPTKENLTESLTWPAKYLVFQNEYFITDIYGNYPEIINQIQKIADNGKISIYKIGSNAASSLHDFLKLDDLQLIENQKMNFDSTCSPALSNCNTTKQQAYSLPNSSLLDSTKEYGLTYRINTAKWLNKKGALLFINTKIWHQKLNKIEMVVSISSNNESKFYKPINLDQLLHKQNQWENLELSYILPPIDCDNGQLGIYFYNPGKNRIYIDDFQFQIYQY